MTLQQLHQVITIAESKSMNEAARKLFVSQPNLSSVVRELEEEAGITIFIRSNRGIVMTPEGDEFIGYAKQVVEQYHLLEKRYMNSEMKKKFSVSMQHYSFAVKAFVEMVKSVGMEEYEFAIHETQTNQVIENVRSMKSELGVLFISEFNEAVLLKLFKEYDLEFEELLHVILMCICGRDIRLRRSHRSVWLNWRSTRVLYLNRERIIRSILRKK